MQETPQRRESGLGPLGMPSWYHHHGAKMRVERLNGNHLLVIAGSAAHVRIARVGIEAQEGWYVDWEVVQSRSEKASGRVFFRSEDLRSAFGLSAASNEFGRSLLARYRGDFAFQGKYIRWGDYLNIPCPGTGHDGDPNVSIYLDEDIMKAVRELTA